MDLEIRKATPYDAKTLATFIMDLDMFSWINEEDSHSFQDRVATQLSLCLADSSHTVLLAVANGEIIGYAAAHWLPYLILRGPEGYVSELFVREESRGAGAGALLLAEIKREAAQRGCSRLSLLNRKSRASYQRGFYQKHEFEERTDMVNFVLSL